MKKMKFTLIAALILSASAIQASPSDTTYVVHGVIIDAKTEDTFCKGYEDGYEDGYCIDDPICIKPTVPVCPIRKVGEEDIYKDGYARGVLDGKKKRNNKNK